MLCEGVKGGKHNARNVNKTYHPFRPLRVDWDEFSMQIRLTYC